MTSGSQSVGKLSIVNDNESRRSFERGPARSPRAATVHGRGGASACCRLFFGTYLVTRMDERRRETVLPPPSVDWLRAPARAAAGRRVADPGREQYECETDRHDSVPHRTPPFSPRSEEHTTKLQSRGHLVCPLLLTNKNS